MGDALSFIGPAISAGSSLLGLSKGSPTQQVPIPTNYPGIQLPSTMAAANQLMTGTSNLQNQYNALFGGLNQWGQGAVANIMDNQGAPGYTAGAQTASGLGQNAALAQYGLGQNLAGYGGQVMNTAFDPQQALYARTLQQLQDQVRAGEAARGISMAPYGAGVENQALSNFNIDWQNQQLQRQLQGLQGAGGAFQTGAGLMGGAAPAYLQASAMPYGAYQQIYGDQLGALGQLAGIYGQGLQAANLPLQNYLNYMNAGLGASQNAAQFAQNAAQQRLAQSAVGFNQGQTLGQQFGQGLQGMAKGWGQAGLPSMGSMIGWGNSGGGTSPWGGYNATGLAA